MAKIGKATISLKMVINGVEHEWVYDPMQQRFDRMDPQTFSRLTKS